MSRFICGVAVAALLAANPARAEEGLWTLDAFPAARMRADHGWAPDRRWLDQVQAAAVKLNNGCSASFVSRQGLILTNRHCVTSCIDSASTASVDYLEAGFVTAGRAEERACLGVRAEVLTAIVDVTPRVRAAIGAATGTALTQARDTAIAAIEREHCTDLATTRCWVVPLFGGGQYKLHRYRTYHDVRLAWAPGASAAKFGGDPDNFSYPRYAMDAAFLRAYENGRPVVTSGHLRWNPRAPVAGETIFVVGSPGYTRRQLTTAELALLRTHEMPLNIDLQSEYRGRLAELTSGNPEWRRQSALNVSWVEHLHKLSRGELSGLNDATLMDRLNADEAELRARTRTLPDAAAIGDPWTDIERAVTRHRAMFRQLYLLANANRGTLHGHAETLVRAAIEREKPDAERLPGFTDAALPQLEQRMAATTAIHPWLEQMYLQVSLSKAREYLGTDDPGVRLLLGKKSPEGLAARLVARTRLGDPAVRVALLRGGMSAIRASDDPMIRHALATEPMGRALRDRYRTEVEAPLAEAHARLAKARFAVHGDRIYPDASRTLRISYGRVQGWTEDQRQIPDRTTFAGLYDRATGQPPFALAAPFVARKDELVLSTAYNFVSTVDAVGGNSGSPMIARDGSVVGAFFDNTFDALAGAYGYDATRNRGVAVSTAAIHAGLTTLYPAPALVKELTAR